MKAVKVQQIVDLWLVNGQMMEAEQSVKIAPDEDAKEPWATVSHHDNETNLSLVNLKKLHELIGKAIQKFENQ